MSKNHSKGKRLIPIPETLLNGLMAAASKESKPLNKYIEDSLQQAVDVSEDGKNLKDIIRFFEILQSQKASGAVFTPLNVFDFLTHKVYVTDKEKLLNIWLESGKWYGTYITEKFKDPVQALAELLRATRWDLNEVTVNGSGDTVKLRCTSTALTKEGTELLVKFIDGALVNMNCELVNSEFMKGLILVEFTLCT
jgi:hypothetical protein